MIRYCANLSATLSALHSQVKAAIPVPVTAFQHHLKPGDWVFIKEFQQFLCASAPYPEHNSLHWDVSDLCPLALNIEPGCSLVLGIAANELTN